MSKKKKSRRAAIRSVVANWLGRGASILIAFIVTPILIHELGDTAYGIWGMVMALGSNYALADLGIRGATVKYFAEFYGKSDLDQQSRLIVTGQVIYFGLAAIVLLIAGVCALAVPLFEKLPQEYIVETQIALLLVGGSVAIKLAGQTSQATLNALKRFELTNLITTSCQIVQAVATVMVVRAEGGLKGMATVFLAVTAIRQALLFATSRFMLRHLNLSWSQFDKSILWKLASFSLSNVIRQVSRRLSQFAGPLVVGGILGPAMVTFYTIAENLIGKVDKLASGISTVVMPVASELDAQRRHSELVQMVTLVPRLMLAISMPVAAIMILLGDDIIRLWIGPEYVRLSYPVLIILSLSFVASRFSGGLRAMLTGMNGVHFVARVAAISSIVTITLSCVLTMVLGLQGMAIAVLAVRLVVDVLVYPNYCCRKFGLTWGEYARRVLPAPTLATLPTILGAILVTEYYPPHRMLVLVIACGLLLALSGLSAFFLCLTSGLRREVMQAVLPARLASKN